MTAREIFRKINSFSLSKIFVLKNIPFPGEGKEERGSKLSSFEYTQNLLTEIKTLIIV